MTAGASGAIVLVMGGPPWPIAALLARIQGGGRAALAESLGPLVLVGAGGPTGDDGAWSFATQHATRGDAPDGFRAMRSDALIHPLQKRGATFAGVILVGRSQSNDVWIDDPTISKLHARIRLGDGGFSVRDAGSRNGTFVEGERIHGETDVSAGERVRFGGVSFRVERTSDLLTRIAAEPRAGA